MPPAVGGHYRPNLSNPFNQLPPSHSTHQPNHHYGHQTQASLSGFHAQPFGTAGGFPAPAGHPSNNIFGSGLPNGGGSFGAGVGSAGVGTGLASHEAQMRFARGGAMQDHHGAMDTDGLGIAPRTPTRVREVWRGNLLQEMAVIRGLIDKYPYISMDTEFPGVVARPMGNFSSKADYHFQCLRCNVDLLKLIQLGITLFTPEGDVPPAQLDASTGSGYPNSLMACPCTWTFNFQFSLTEDMYSADSIDMLQKAGVDFKKCETMGIDPKEFGSLLITSGMVLDPDVTWLSFHSGYDFGYLVKMMSRKPLPQDEEEYLSIVRTWFPRIYDMKFLLRHVVKANQRGVLNQQGSAIVNSLNGRSGLQDLANELGCMREGIAHTAGSDAWLTGAVFWAMRDKMFDKQIPEELMGMIWGLSSVGQPASAASQAAALAGHQGPNTNGASLYHTGMTPSSMRDTPSTPGNSHAGLANSTPGPHGYSSGMAGLTGGAFSGFQYSRYELPHFKFPRPHASHDQNVPHQPNHLLPHGFENYHGSRPSPNHYQQEWHRDVALHSHGLPVGPIQAQHFHGNLPSPSPIPPAENIASRDSLLNTLLNTPVRHRHPISPPRTPSPKTTPPSQSPSEEKSLSEPPPIASAAHFPPLATPIKTPQRSLTLNYETRSAPSKDPRNGVRSGMMLRGVGSGRGMRGIHAFRVNSRRAGQAA